MKKPTCCQCKSLAKLDIGFVQKTKITTLVTHIHQTHASIPQPFGNNEQLFLFLFLFCLCEEFPCLRGRGAGSRYSLTLIFGIFGGHLN